MKHNNIIFVFFVVSAANLVRADFLITTACNGTNSITGSSAYIENGNCVQYGNGNATYLIKCDYEHDAYYSYQCYDETCNDCSPLTSQSTNACIDGSMNLCTDKIPYDLILPKIGITENTNYYAEYKVDYMVENCMGDIFSMTIEAPQACITNFDSHKTICNLSAETFTYITYQDTFCKHTDTVQTEMSGTCTGQTFAGCNLPLDFPKHINK